MYFAAITKILINIFSVSIQIKFLKTQFFAPTIEINLRLYLTQYTFDLKYVKIYQQIISYLQSLIHYFKQSYISVK